jgi:hypothetical protein
LYAGCSKNNRVHTRVYGKSRTYEGFNNVKPVQVNTGAVSRAGYFQGKLSGLSDGSASIRVEDRLDGASNFLSWKARVTLALKQYDLWELVDKAVVPPIGLQALANHEKEIKIERVILDSMKDHLIPHLSEKKTAKIWLIIDALVRLFQSINMNRNMVLKNKLKSV